jgi:hypothetical protein
MTCRRYGRLSATPRGLRLVRTQPAAAALNDPHTANLFYIYVFMLIEPSFYRISLVAMPGGRRSDEASAGCLRKVIKGRQQLLVLYIV